MTKGNTTLKEVAQNVNISSRYLHGIFKDIIGSTPAVYTLKIRSQSNSELASPSSGHDLQVHDNSVTTSPVGGGCLPDDGDFAFMELNMKHYASVAAYEAVEEQLKLFDQEENILGWPQDEAMSTGLECSTDEFFDFSAYDSFSDPDVLDQFTFG